MEKDELGTTKYMIHAIIDADGVVEKPDVVGAIFGQTEGLLGSDLDLRELQKTGRIGRIEVEIKSEGGRSRGTITVPSSLDKVETAILASALETIDRVGPCTAHIRIDRIEDVRTTKRRRIIERSKEILSTLIDELGPESQELAEEVRRAVRIKEITEYGPEKLPAGPNIAESDTIIVVEGRADVLNLLKDGIRNAIAVEGTKIPKTIIDLSKEKIVIAFVDGDRGGELILKELLQTADIDYIARAPEGKEVEELTKKEIIKALRNKIPVEQITTFYTPLKREETKHRIQVQKPSEKIFKPDDDLFRFGLILNDLSGSLKARLYDSEINLVNEVPVRDLARCLNESENDIYAIVFDGVVTQRLVDIATEKGLTYLIGAKMGNIVKRPLGLKILTLKELNPNSVGQGT
ncbi:MAG: DNA primase DnaG [Candidatus Hydrothermarchaeota archaeon]